MAPRLDLSQADLLRAIYDATKRSPGGEGLRVAEIVEQTGSDRTKVERAIRVGLQTGTVRRTSKLVERIDGVVRPVPSYVFLKKHKGDR